MSGHLFSNPHGFPADSRFLEGHFPDNPIVPGAVILAYLSRCLAEQGVRLQEIERMKFMRPLRPGTCFEIVVEGPAEASKVAFRDGDGVFATARAVLSSTDV